jgi:hypothetical protein
MAPSLQQAMEIAHKKAYVILDGSLLRKDQVAMSSDRDRPFSPGKHETGRCSTPCRGLDAVVKRADSGHFTGELARAALIVHSSPRNLSTPRRSPVAPILSCSDSSRTRILWTATQEHSTEWSPTSTWPPVSGRSRWSTGTGTGPRSRTCSFSGGSGPCRMTSHEPGDLARGAVVLRGCCARRW